MVVKICLYDIRAMIGDDVKLNEIVKYKNDFNNQELRKFTAEELNLLMTILHKVRDNGTKILNFSFNELKKLIRLEKNMTIIMHVNKKIACIKLYFSDRRAYNPICTFSGICNKC